MGSDFGKRRVATTGLTGVAVAVAVAALTQWLGATSQATRPGGLIRHDSGQSVSPVYEGWYQQPDGRIAASFGYFNRNYEEEVHIPVGPDNRIQPGPADQGQPTYFFPRRQVGVFVITLPADTSNEVAWVLTARGETLEIPVNLDQEYLIEPFRAAAGPSPGNTPPVLRFDPADDDIRGPAGAVLQRAATVGTPLALDVWVSDDGLGASGDEPELTVTWRKFRGAGMVSFDESSPPIETGKASTSASFADAGEYWLSVLVSDGSRQSNQCCWTNGYLRVIVTAAGDR